MITEAQARTIALSMPEATEREHMNHPDFRVGNKIFATLWPDESKAVVFAKPETHDDLLQRYPKVFSLNGWSKNFGALTVHLNHVSKKQFQGLIHDSWCAKAPKSLVREHP